MQEAINEAQSIIGDRLDRELESIDPNNVKRDINNLLWSYMPSETTMEDADTISMVVLDMIQTPQKYLKPELTE